MVWKWQIGRQKKTNYEAQRSEKQVSRFPFFSLHIEFRRAEGNSSTKKDEIALVLLLQMFFHIYTVGWVEAVLLLQDGWFYTITGGLSRYDLLGSVSAEHVVAPLIRSLASLTHSPTPLTRSLAPHCSLRPRAPRWCSKIRLFRTTVQPTDEPGLLCSCKNAKRCWEAEMCLMAFSKNALAKNGV